MSTNKQFDLRSNSDWLLRILLLIIIIASSFYFRIFPAYEFVFPNSSDVNLLGVDPYFYLRHVITTFNNYPHLQVFDHATHYPSGINSDATGFYTLFLATVCKVILGSAASDNEIAHVLAWVSPVASCMIVGLIFYISSKIKNSISGILSSLIILLYPGLFLSRSLLGFPDHHVIEILLSLWLLSLVTKNFRLIQNNSFKIWHSLWTVLPFVLFFVSWPGAQLYILLASILFLNYIVFFNANSRQYDDLLRYSLTFFISSATIIFLIQILYPDLITSAFKNYDHLTSPILIISSALCSLVIFFKRLLIKHITHSYIVLVAFLLEIVIGGVILFTTQIGGDVLKRLVYRSENLQENRAINYLDMVDMISIPGILAIIVSLYYLYQFTRNKQKYIHYLPSIILTFFFLFMWTTTYDMGYMVMPFVAILTGVFIFDLITFIVQFDHRIRVVKYSKFLLGGFLLLFTITKPLIFNSQKYPFVNSPEQISQLQFYTPAWLDAMDWLSDNTPTLDVPTDSIVNQINYTDQSGQYGVLSSWDYGNIINQRGKRIPTWSRWPNNKLEKPLYSKNEDQLCLRCIAKGSIKYIVVNDKMAGAFFLQKYSEIHGSIESCTATINLTNEDLNFEAPTLGSCYESSLIYQLYREVNYDTTKYKMIWESNEETLSGYYYNNNQLTLLTLEPNNIEKLSNVNLDSLSFFKINNGLMYNTYLGPEVKIYEVLPSQPLSN